MLPASRECRMGLAFERHGSGPPLVLLHGVGPPPQAWGAGLERLAACRDVVLLGPPGPAGGAVVLGALRGHGESPPLRPAGRPVVEALLDEVLGLLDELELDRPHLAGNSLGGRLALEAGVARRAATVTALSPAGFWRAAGEARYARAVFKIMEFGGARLPLPAPALARRPPGRAPIYSAALSRPSR